MRILVFLVGGNLRLTERSWLNQCPMSPKPGSSSEGWHGLARSMGAKQEQGSFNAAATGRGPTP